MTNEDIARQTIEVIWCRGEVDRIPEFYTEDFHAHQPNIRLNWTGIPGRPTWVGHEGLRNIVTWIKSVCPDYHEAPQLVVGSGDMVAMRMINTGTHTGRASDVSSRPVSRSRRWIRCSCAWSADGSRSSGGCLISMQSVCNSGS